MPNNPNEFDRLMTKFKNAWINDSDDHPDEDIAYFELTVDGQEILLPWQVILQCLSYAQDMNIVPRLPNDWWRQTKGDYSLDTVQLGAKEEIVRSGLTLISEESDVLETGICSEDKTWLLVKLGVFSSICLDAYHEDSRLVAHTLLDLLNNSYPECKKYFDLKLLEKFANPTMLSAQ